MSLILNNYKYSLAYNKLNNLNIAQPHMFFTPCKYDIILMNSIILETFSTVCLKKTMEKKIWYIPVYCGYFVSFYMFPKSLKKYSLSTAYTIWCGIGILLTTILDNIIYKEILTLHP